MKRLAPAMAVLVTAVPGASAQPAAPPACSLLDRADGVSRAGADLGYSLFDNDEVDFTALRVDLHGQWTSTLGAGGYAILPLSYARLETEVGMFEDSEWQLGDVELGGVYRRELAPGLGLAARAGVTLPTAREGSFGATEIEGFANDTARWARPNDLVQAVPEATYLRLGVSPIYTSGQLFLRADLAADVPIHSGTGDDLMTLARVNGAAGVLAGPTALMIEVVNLIALEEPEMEDEDRLLTFVGLTARYVGGPIQPSASLLLPLDQDVSDAMDMALLVGAHALLP